MARPAATFYEFSFVKNEWSTVSTRGVAPSQRKFCSAVVYNDSLYVFGGHDGDRRLNDFFSYNFREWERPYNRERESGLLFYLPLESNVCVVWYELAVNRQ